MASQLEEKMIVDPRKWIFDREELEKAPELKDLYWVERKFVNFGFRAHPEIKMSMCAGSLCQMHGETTNIWSHLLGMIYFIMLFVLMLFSPTGEEDPLNPFKQYTTETSAMLSRVGCVSVILCMGMSAFYHTFNPMSKTWNEQLLRLDLMCVGIMILTLTNCLAYVAYHQFPEFRYFFCIGLIVVQVLLLAVNLIPTFTQPQYENHRRVLYALLVGLIAGIAICWLFKATGEEIKMFIGWVLLSFLWLGLGMGFYAGKFPERAFPQSRMIAYWFSSHTWWHFAAILCANQMLWLTWRYSIYVENL